MGRISILYFFALAIALFFTSRSQAAQTVKKLAPRLDAEITEIGDQAVLTNINYQTTSEKQKSLVLGVGFFVVDSPLITQPAASAVCRQFGYRDAENASWETNAVEENEILYLADPRTLHLQVSYGKDLPGKRLPEKVVDSRTVKHLTSVVCRS